MAKVRTPLISFGASGKIAKTIVFFAWKGLDVVREYVTPSNPKTADQVTQRGIFADMVLSWRTYFTNALMRTAWNLSATVSKSPQSGFNVAMSNMMQVAATDADASFALSCAANAGNTALITMKNVDDGGAGDEAGNFEIWTGSSADSLLKFEDVAIAAGTLTTADLGDLDDVKYVQVRKGGYDRSGISKITLIA